MKLKTLLTDKSWLNVLNEEFNKPYIIDLEVFLNKQLSMGKVIYPPENKIFNALNLTPLDSVRVVILGQDPYHGSGQAHGLSFSVQQGVPIPPSLKNIYKELERDLSFSPVNHGDLKGWCDQGVLLLNTTLTVEQSKAGSHQHKGWEKLTDKIITILNQQNSPIVFLLWGASSRKKRALIGNSKNLILEAPHPSPLSAYRGFLGCGHFSKTNKYLKKHKRREIYWQL